MASSSAEYKDMSSLDLLEKEDRILLDLFGQIRSNQGQSVDQRYVYGNAAKQVIRHVSIRQASLMDVVATIKATAAVIAIADRLFDRAVRRRRLYGDLADMSRGIQGIYLNTAQAFNEKISAFMAQIEPEIHWELEESIPTIRGAVSEGLPQRSLRSAHYIRRHAPTRLNPSGPSWRETIPVISRIATLIDHFADHPRATPEDRRS